MMWYPGKIVKRFIGKGYGVRTSEEVPLPGHYYIYKDVITITVEGNTATLHFETGEPKSFSPVKKVTSCPPYPGPGGFFEQCGMTGTIAFSFDVANNRYEIAFGAPVSARVEHKYDGYYIYVY